MSEQIKIAIIGGGAAGCFCAARLCELLTEAGIPISGGELPGEHQKVQIRIYEAQGRAMSKLAITGGGRCNITNSFAKIEKLSDAYPRGERLVKAAFRNFSPQQCVAWWEERGVPLVKQSDECIFPKSQDAMQVVRTLQRLSSPVRYELGQKVTSIRTLEKGYELTVDAKKNSQQALNVSGTVYADIVVVTTGGGALKLLEPLGISIERPIPSLFTFRLSDLQISSSVPSLKPLSLGNYTSRRAQSNVDSVSAITALMGTVVENATLILAGTKFRSQGTLLITDWGVSGPATLKLSAYGARELAEKNYQGTLLINYLSISEEELRGKLLQLAKQNPQKMLINTPLEGLTQRLWQYLVCKRAEIRADMRWAELGSKGLSKLVSVLVSDTYQITGRCRFKDEFVTAGGVSQSEVNPKTFESKRYEALYFAGEVLDIDAITGGFNLQAAWSTAYTVARSVFQRISIERIK